LHSDDRKIAPVPILGLDEIQRLPSLLNEVHRFIEDQRMRFVLLGSSARKLKQAGTNLLAGRALHRQMFPLLPQELGRDFNLADVLRHGSLPVIWAAKERREALESYVQMYLKEEIQAESLVRNLPGFARFLPVAAVFHGQVLSVAGLNRRLIVYLGERPQRTEDGIDVLPLGGFLAAFEERSLW
jgi:predicted AAA+ superfamily ATPase